MRQVDANEEEPRSGWTVHESERRYRDFERMRKESMAKLLIVAAAVAYTWRHVT